jgi:hypothetical protein
MEAIGQLLDHLGYATPLLYAAAAYGLFYRLDENTSDEAKAAVTSTMQSKGIEAKRVVSALLEIFDRIYTNPLWSVRAFRRSTILTIVAGVATLPIIARLVDLIPQSDSPAPALSANETHILSLAFLILSLSVNILTDYVSLFFVRRWLKTAGARRPVLALMLGALTAVVIVTLGNLLRSILDIGFLISIIVFKGYGSTLRFDQSGRLFFFTFIFSIPALVVFVWLPLLAIGILVARASGPFLWAVGRTQWFLKDGQNHPLKAVGCVATVVVFGVGLILHTLI